LSGTAAAGAGSESFKDFETKVTASVLVAGRTVGPGATAGWALPGVGVPPTWSSGWALPEPGLGPALGSDGQPPRRSATDRPARTVSRRLVWGLAGDMTPSGS